VTHRIATMTVWYATTLHYTDKIQ